MLLVALEAIASFLGAAAGKFMEIPVANLSPFRHSVFVLFRLIFRLHVVINF